MTGPIGTVPLLASPAATITLYTPSVDVDEAADTSTPPGPASTVHTGRSPRVGTSEMMNRPRPSAHTSTPTARASDASVPSMASQRSRSHVVYGTDRKSVA